MNNIDNTIENIGQKIKYFRNLNKVSLSKLAKEANISKSTLFGLEEGRSNPTISTLINISKTLNIKLTELIGDSEKTYSTALVLISENSSRYIYKLSLIENQIFNFNEDIYCNIDITLLKGELFYIDKAKKILENETSKLYSNAKIKAGEDGAIAIVTMKKDYNNNYIQEDIFIEKSTTSSLEALSYMARSSKIVRAISSSIYPVEPPTKIENIQIFEIQEKKELHYYFLSTLSGIIGGVNNLISGLKLQPTKKLSKIVNFLKKVNTKEQLLESDFKDIEKNPVNSLIEELTKLIEERYSNCYILTNANNLDIDDSENYSYVLIIDELIEETQNLINSSILIDIYRAVELLFSIKEQELTDQELENYLSIRSNLIQALYFAKNNYIPLALKYIKLSITDNSIEISHEAMKFYQEAINLAKQALDNKDKLKTYTTKDTLEQKISDLNLKTIIKVNINPSIGKDGKYIYLLKSVL